MPHSRHTDINMEQLQAVPELNILTASKEAGVCLIVSKDETQVFLTGHPEYDTNTLLQEYERDLERNLSTVEEPKHYFAKGSNEPVNRWKAHATLLFMNWLNYYVYQETPYEWD